MNTYTTHDMVLNLMISKPETRNDNYALFYWVCKTINPEVEFMPFSRVMLWHKVLGLPSLETVGRCRRRVVNKYPELQAVEEVVEGRKANEKEIREYAKGDI